MGAVVTTFAFLPPDRQQAKLKEHASTVYVTSEAGDSIPILRVGSLRSHDDLVLIYCHGNAEDLGQIRLLLQDLADRLNLPVFGFDYPGYGTASGKPSEAGCFAAAKAVWRHVRGLAPSARIILYGRSLGSGPAVHLAAGGADGEERRASGLVLQSPLCSGIGTVLGKPGEVMLKHIDVMRNIDLMASVRCPVCIIHGTDDGVVPVSHGRRLDAIARRHAVWTHEPLWLQGYGHNNMPWDQCANHVEDFLAVLRCTEEEG
ncbi:hypothetical protein AB1Y20_014346 [Prymnesium parvum]|uniref:Serine aminopeptidase S33 domain-containing protein n=1 Tax=Prymnesium parvum TaxID=97485 RepID=A0AB34IDF5_PRYPA|mmetsp:Transcript_49476/g.122996  ORF Transcript_49476/g.122996 Transcript_49476/m.122996 type:complete len:260 (-) Transcript_49476:371-1150(-)